MESSSQLIIHPPTSPFSPPDTFRARAQCVDLFPSISIDVASPSAQYNLDIGRTWRTKGESQKRYFRSLSCPLPVLAAAHSERAPLPWDYFAAGEMGDLVDDPSAQSPLDSPSDDYDDDSSQWQLQNTDNKLSNASGSNVASVPPTPKSTVPLQKRRRVTRACDECRRKKVARNSLVLRTL